MTNPQLLDGSKREYNVSENNKAIGWTQSQPVKPRGQKSWVDLSIEQNNDFKSIYEKCKRSWIIPDWCAIVRVAICRTWMNVFLVCFFPICFFQIQILCQTIPLDTFLCSSHCTVISCTVTTAKHHLLLSYLIKG